jgi:hypothetical protein
LGRNRFYIGNGRAGMEKTESALETKSVGYLEAFLYRVPKRNHTAIKQNLKKFMQWFKKNGIMLGTTS